MSEMKRIDVNNLKSMGDKESQYASSSSNNIGVPRQFRKTFNSDVPHAQMDQQTHVSQSPVKPAYLKNSTQSQAPRVNINKKFATNDLIY